MRKGQAQLEAIVCIAVLLAVIASAIGAVNSIAEKAVVAGENAVAEAKAQKCALAAGTLFSNGGGLLKIEEICFAGKEHEVKAVYRGTEKYAFSSAPNIKMVQTGSKTVMEIGVDAHYN